MAESLEQFAPGQQLASTLVATGDVSIGLGITHCNGSINMLTWIRAYSSETIFNQSSRAGVEISDLRLRLRAKFRGGILRCVEFRFWGV